MMNKNNSACIVAMVLLNFAGYTSNSFAEPESVLVRRDRKITTVISVLEEHATTLRRNRNAIRRIESRMKQLGVPPCKLELWLKSGQVLGMVDENPEDFVMKRLDIHEKLIQQTMKALSNEVALLRNRDELTQAGVRKLAERIATDSSSIEHIKKEVIPRIAATATVNKRRITETQVFLLALEQDYAKKFESICQQLEELKRRTVLMPEREPADIAPQLTPPAPIPNNNPIARPAVNARPPATPKLLPGYVVYSRDAFCPFAKMIRRNHYCAWTETTNGIARPVSYRGDLYRDCKGLLVLLVKR